MSHQRMLSNNVSPIGTLKVIQYASQVVIDRVAKMHRMRQEFLELSAMSNIELHDIGIGREDIFAVISGSYDAESH